MLQLKGSHQPPVYRRLIYFHKYKERKRHGCKGLPGGRLLRGPYRMVVPMPKLFPDGYESEVMSQAETSADTVTGYKPSLYFDGEDILRDGQNRVIESTGIEAWEQWCMKCLLTERYKYPAYSTDYGIEVDEALLAETREKAESILTREINEALLADPYGRTSYIEDIAYDWTVSPDSVQIQIVAVGLSDVTIDFTIRMKGVMRSG